MNSSEDEQGIPYCRASNDRATPTPRDLCAAEGCRNARVAPGQYCAGHTPGAGGAADVDPRRPPRVGDAVRVADFRGRSRAFHNRYENRIGHVVAFSTGGGVRVKFQGIKTVQYWPFAALRLIDESEKEGGAGDVGEVERLARAATPGPWHVVYDTNVRGLRRDVGYETVIANTGTFSSNICDVTPENRANADYIAAANPAAVLALIAERDALRAMLEKLPHHDTCKWWRTSNPGLNDCTCGKYAALARVPAAGEKAG